MIKKEKELTYEKNDEKSLTLLLFLVFLLAILPARASAADVIASGECGAEGGDLTWTLDSDGVLTISGTGAITNPAWRDYFADITEVVSENGVTNIGDYFFFYCKSLMSATIPDSVTVIGECAFAKCVSLTSITIPNRLSFIGCGAFESCISLPSVTIPDSVTAIGNAAFYGCHSLISIAIPSSVTSIGNYAFQSCSKLTGIIVAADNTHYCSIDGDLYSKDMTVLIQHPAGKNGACWIPDSVTFIAEGAFSFSNKNDNTVTDVYYGGTEAQWAAVGIGEANEPLSGAAVHFGSLTPGSGNEEAPAPPANAPVVQVSTQKLAVDSVEMDIEHYNIDGSNYFKLRDLAPYLDFGVNYDAATRTATIITE